MALRALQVYYRRSGKYFSKFNCYKVIYIQFTAQTASTYIFICKTKKNLEHRYITLLHVEYVHTQCVCKNLKFSSLLRGSSALWVRRGGGQKFNAWQLSQPVLIFYVVQMSHASSLGQMNSARLNRVQVFVGTADCKLGNQTHCQWSRYCKRGWRLVEFAETLSYVSFASFLCQWWWRMSSIFRTRLSSYTFYRSCLKGVLKLILRCDELYRLYQCWWKLKNRGFPTQTPIAWFRSL